jgi:uncharacterized protein (UPF0333 family)
MKRITKSRKAQLSIEAAIVLLFLLMVLTSVWLGGPMHQSVEKSTDTNGILLAAKSLDTVAAAVEEVGMSGIGARKDFVMHIPFNTVDIQYYEDPYPHINMTVLLYSDVSSNDSAVEFDKYSVDSEGKPEWYGQGGPHETDFYYQTLTKKLAYPIASTDYFPLCEVSARKPANISRGPSTTFYFNGTKGLQPLTFCCEAGFNLHMYVERSPSIASDASESKYAVDWRHYYSLPGRWDLKT